MQTMETKGKYLLRADNIGERLCLVALCKKLPDHYREDATNNWVVCDKSWAEIQADLIDAENGLECPEYEI